MNIKEIIKLKTGGQWLVSPAAKDKIFCRELFSEEHLAHCLGHDHVRQHRQAAQAADRGQDVAQRNHDEQAVVGGRQAERPACASG